MLIIVTFAGLAALIYGLLNQEPDVVCIQAPCPTGTREAQLAILVGVVLLVIALIMWARRRRQG